MLSGGVSLSLSLSLSFLVFLPFIFHGYLLPFLSLSLFLHLLRPQSPCWAEVIKEA